MSENYISIQLSDAEKEDQLIIEQELTEQTANIVGTSYKGPAFVPQKIYFGSRINGQEVYNTKQNILGTIRQNQIGHLYDEYACFNESSGYDALDFWLSNGGQYAYYTRVLGIGINEKNDTTNKMIGSGFNVSNNISSGTLSHTRSDNLNAIAGGPKGNTTFVLRTLNEESKRQSLNDVFVDVSTIDYISEIGYNNNSQSYDITENTNFISDVILFPSGVLPNLSDNIENLENRPYGYYENASSYESQLKDEIETTNCFLNLSGFKPYEINNDFKNKPWTYIRIESNNNTNYLKKQIQYSNLDKNYFSNRFLERGHLTYASFPFSGININSEKNHKFNILCTKEYADVIQGLSNEENQIPDFNSFESEFTTAKTPWITSQPNNRAELTNNRENIHKKVNDLFRFWSLDDGEIGNRFRIKINITKRGEQTSYKSKDTDYCEFDIYFLEYEPRNNSYNIVETYENLNLNPKSKNYIARKIGTEYKYYDFKTNKVIQKGKFTNKSQILRVEIHKSIDEEVYENQHQIIPSGFRSYPHIKLQKNAFKNFSNNIDNLFDTQGVYQMPPMYSLNFYEDYVLGRNSNIQNSWGVVFSQSTVVNNVFKPQFDSSSLNNEQELLRAISPHFYYTKYFLSECSDSTKNVWVDEDNYLNSFFHLEKIIIKDSSKYDKNNPRNMCYKHSGRLLPLTLNSNYEYLNLDDDKYWKEDRFLKKQYENKLSFDFFTYGGFDGVDIRDIDKKSLKNDAIVREFLDSNESKSTYTSYDKAIDIALDDSNCTSDIFLIPGIKEISLIDKVVKKCEEDKNHFFIADISGAASSNLVSFVNDSNKTLITSYGVMGNFYLIENTLNDYVLNSYSLTSEDFRFKLSENSYYSYQSLLEKQFDFTIQKWNNLNINSRYFMPVFGELETASISTNVDFQKKISPESFALAKIASQPNARFSITAINSLPQSNQLQNLLSYRTINMLNHLENNVDFNQKTSITKSSGTNLVYKPLGNSNINLISENTSYENRRSIFQQQSIIRTIQEIKKRVKYNIFTDDSLIEGGFLFSQNANFKNLYSKLEIQINSLLEDFLNEGLIENYKLRISKKEDTQTILDMQNYIIRGNIILQFGESDIINLQLDELLNNLSLLTGDSQDSVEVPKF